MAAAAAAAFVIVAISRQKSYASFTLFRSILLQHTLRIKWEPFDNLWMARAFFLISESKEKCGAFDDIPALCQRNDGESYISFGIASTNHTHTVHIILL